MERDRCGRLISASYYPRDLPLAPAAQPCPAHHGRHDSLPGQFVSIYQMCDTPLPVNWTIETLNTAVDKELAALPVDMRARFVRICELIEAVGLDRVGAPYIRHLTGPLWEMRMKGRDGISRALYVAVRGKRVVVVRAFMKKTRQTPRQEIDLALRRAREVLQ